MKNNITLPEGANPEAFQNYFLDFLGNNLSNSLCNSISNLLAIDYSGRLESAPNLKEYINLCALRIKKSLGLKVVTDESFSSAMTLFTIAITPERDIDEDDSISQEKSQDALIDSVIAVHFVNLSPKETTLIKSLMKELLNGKDGKEMMNAISSNPKLFYSVVVSALRENKKQKEVSEAIHQHLTTISSKDRQNEKQKTGVKSLSSQIALAGGLMIAASTGLILEGLALPALIIPATAAAIKLAPKLGEQTADSLSQNSTTIKPKDSKPLTNEPKTTNKDNSITKPTVKPNLSKQELKDLVKTVDIKETTITEEIEQSKSEKLLQDKEISKTQKGRTK